EEAYAVLTQSPKAHLPFLEHFCFLATLHRDLPNSGDFQLGIVKKLAIKRFDSLSRSLYSRHLYGLPTLLGRFPNLPLTIAVGAKVDPPTISGPARTHIVRRPCSYAMHRASVGADHINVLIASLGVIECDPSTVR